MVRWFAGFDSREALAWAVLVQSIISRTNLPLAFTPVGDEILPKSLWWRPRGPKDSTAFSNCRFLVPALCDYEGWAVFSDSDMVCVDDVRDLWDQRDERYALQVVKHRHVPAERRKFLGAEQAVYRRKNWSSLMLMNCAHPACRELTLQYVNSAPGLDLHGFAWVADESLIGSIEGGWNILSTSPDSLEHPDYHDGDPVSLIHYTRGGPWHSRQDAGHDVWLDALSDLLSGPNPQAVCHIRHEGPGSPILVDLAFKANDEDTH